MEEKYKKLRLKCPKCDSADVNLYRDIFLCFNCKFKMPTDEFVKIFGGENE